MRHVNKELLSVGLPPKRRLTVEVTSTTEQAAARSVVGRVLDSVWGKNTFQKRWITQCTRFSVRKPAPLSNLRNATRLVLGCRFAEVVSCSKETRGRAHAGTDFTRIAGTTNIPARETPEQAGERRERSLGKWAWSARLTKSMRRLIPPLVAGSVWEPSSTPDLERDKQYLGFVSQFDRTTYDLSPEQNQEWAFRP